MSAKNIEVIFSDSGKIQARVTSILLNRYLTPDPCMEFPLGFKISIFDSALRTETSIMATTGKEKKMPGSWKPG